MSRSTNTVLVTVPASEWALELELGLDLESPLVSASVWVAASPPALVLEWVSPTASVSGLLLATDSASVLPFLMEWPPDRRLHLRRRSRCMTHPERTRREIFPSQSLRRLHP